MPEPDPQPIPIRPLSRRASRTFVLVSVLIALAVALAAVWYLTRAAMDNKEQIEANTKPADSSAVRGFGVTEY